MNARYAALCGITDAELDSYFSEPIGVLAYNNQLTIDEMRKALKLFYDGYHFNDSMLGIYNPYSLFNALANNDLRSYWFTSGTPSYLLKLLQGSEVDMNSLLDKEYSSDYFIDYRVSIQDPLAMLYQSGYLTIKEVKPQDDATKLYRLDYPNMEVKRGFVSLLANSYFGIQENV